MIIDSHHHFWTPSSAKYPWMSGKFARINRPFGPSDLAVERGRNDVSCTVLVQTWSSLEETVSFLNLAYSDPSIAGVTGWVDLTKDDVGATLDSLRSGAPRRALVSLRHQVHDEPDPKWLERRDVRAALAVVEAHDLAFDLLVRPRELPSAIDTVRRFPGLRFVVDHIAKPDIRNRQWQPWADQIAELATCSNVYCKLSGIITEADWTSWTTEQLLPYIRHVLECFGPRRCMYGSDWPVCLVAGEYSDTLDVVCAALSGAPLPDMERVMSGTAIEAYRLEVAG